jgi:hypothetical protein
LRCEASPKALALNPFSLASAIMIMYNITSLPSDRHISLLGASTMHPSYPGIKLRIVEFIEKLTKEQHIIKQAEFPAMGLRKK